jgi:hypothetical protein
MKRLRSRLAYTCKPDAQRWPPATKLIEKASIEQRLWFFFTGHTRQFRMHGKSGTREAWRLQRISANSDASSRHMTFKRICLISAENARDSFSVRTGF